MKRLTSILFAFTILLSTSAFAQDYKFGHINSQDLLAQLPDRNAAQQEIEAYASKLEEQQKSMEDELNNKYEDYLAKRDTYTDLIKATKEKELQQIQQQITTFNQVAMQDLQQKESDLIKPIIDKVQKAIDEVGKENGFTFIFDLANRTVLYHSTQSVDITPLVKKKLGIEQ
ncbi:OmpH family outer membrane protein [Saccharicrinis sp. FJH2]|uniref:OmpH family outer membrane protein n=1 Tax=Saccharicrinis sp. FJH65 TaxID=3344659 RepID=UPI0035F48F1F